MVFLGEPDQLSSQMQKKQMFDSFRYVRINISPAFTGRLRRGSERVASWDVFLGGDREGRATKSCIIAQANGRFDNSMPWISL